MENIKYTCNRNSINVPHTLLKPDQIKLRSVDRGQFVSCPRILVSWFTVTFFLPQWKLVFSVHGRTFIVRNNVWQPLHLLGWSFLVGEYDRSVDVRLPPQTQQITEQHNTNKQHFVPSPLTTITKLWIDTRRSTSARWNYAYTTQQLPERSRPLIASLLTELPPVPRKITLVIKLKRSETCV